jgi:RNA polymerase sigma-70 factor (ECF subfamily)
LNWSGRTVLNFGFTNETGPAIGKNFGTSLRTLVSKGRTVRNARARREKASGLWGVRVSYGEPIALRGQAELDQVAPATTTKVRPSADEQFIERLKSGDLAAFDRLVSDRSGEIFALLFRLTEDPEEARDLTQETFLRAFQSIARFRGDSDLRTWIYRIAINQARNRWRWWRRRRRDSTISIDVELNGRSGTISSTLRAGDESNPELGTIARERELILRKALASLGTIYREVVVLRDIEGLTYEEIASTLEVSVGTVKSRLSRGRVELKRRVENSL